MDEYEIKQLMEDCVVKKRAPIIIKPDYISEEDQLSRRKLEAHKIASELHYSEEILTRIKKAITFGEIDRALAAGRKQISDISIDHFRKKKG